MKISSFFILIIYQLVGFGTSQGGDCPDGWAKFKDESCYLLLSTHDTYDAAKSSCAGLGGYLPHVKDEDQQIFLNNYIFNQNDVQSNVWIGATRASQNEFKWNDATYVDYSNWDDQRPTSVLGRDCVAMQSRYSSLSEEEGKWKDVSCNSVSRVLCEKAQNWTNDDIQRALLENRRQLENLLKNPVPIGFIYIEYHGQPAPESMWPQVIWTDVTSTYSGLFFRALGNGSEEFGTIQESDSPRLLSVQSDHGKPFREGKDVVDTKPGNWSEWIYTGRNGGNFKWSHRYFVSNPEVRPKNAAVKIWKREA